jgi:hypothetical protein
MKDKKDRIIELEEQRARINAQIQRVKAREQKRTSRDDTRRKVLVGALILGRVENKLMSREQLLADLDPFLIRDNDRALFDLPPLPKAEETATTNPGDATKAGDSGS